MSSPVRNRLLAALSPDDLALLQPHLEPVPLRLHDSLIAADSVIGHALFPLSGMVSIVADAVDCRIEIGLIGREGMVGASLALGVEDSPQMCMVQAEGDGLRIRAADFRQALDASRSLQALLLRYVHTLLVQTAATAYANAAHTLEGRLARWLLMSRDRMDSDALTLTHEFLSMMLGVRRAGVTTALHSLEGMGAIKAGRRQITIVDREILEDLADESYGQPEAAYARAIGDLRPTMPS